MLDALRSRDFRIFWTSLAVSAVASGVQVFALGILVVQIADREGKPELAPLYLGFVGLARAAPGLIVTLIAGALADRLDRKRLILGTQATMGLNAGLLALFVLFGVASLWNVLLASAIHSATVAVDNPTRNSVIPRLVPRRFLSSGIGLKVAADNGGLTIGPLLGGLLYLPIGVGGLLGASALTFAAVVGGVAAIRPVQPKAAVSSQTLLGSILEGARYVRRDPSLPWILTLAGTLCVTVWPATQLLPAVTGESLFWGMSLLSLLLAAMGLGAFSAAIGIMNVGRFSSLGRVFIVGAAANSIALVLLALAADPLLAVVFSYVLGAAGILMAATANNMIQATTTDAYRGRVMSLWGFLFIGLLPLGVLALGALGTLFGIHAALTAGGIVGICASVYAAVRVPALRDWRVSAEPRPVTPAAVVADPTGVIALPVER